MGAERFKLLNSASIIEPILPDGSIGRGSLSHDIHSEWFIPVNIQSRWIATALVLEIQVAFFDKDVSPNIINSFLLKGPLDRGLKSIDGSLVSFSIPTSTPRDFFSIS